MEREKAKKKMFMEIYFIKKAFSEDQNLNLDFYIHIWDLNRRDILATSHTEEPFLILIFRLDLIVRGKRCAELIMERTFLREFDFV